MKKTKESQYNDLLVDYSLNGSAQMGYRANYLYRHDPKRLAIWLSRYKFILKMFDGYNKVLEIGCGDSFGTNLVASGVNEIVATDFDEIFIEQNIKLRNEYNNITFKVHNILTSPFKEEFNGIYSLDVLEHISTEDEDKYMTNIINSLDKNGTVIIGMPSIESEKYASPGNKLGHVNCKSGNDLSKFCKQYFHNVFIFSMNDEVLHTGYFPMSHYLFALCVNPKVKKL